MKKRAIQFLLLTLTVLTLAGCDKDSVKAFVLDGTWTGYLETYYQDRWGTTGKTFRTTMRFIQQGMYDGYGYEVDYDTRSPYQDYYFTEFTWRVSDGSIYIRYADSWNTVRIYDYTLNLASFRGYMDDGTSRDIYFDFSPTSNFDWSPYENWRTRSGAGEQFHASGVFAQ